MSTVLLFSIRREYFILRIHSRLRLRGLNLSISTLDSDSRVLVFQSPTDDSKSEVLAPQLPTPRFYFFLLPHSRLRISSFFLFPSPEFNFFDFDSLLRIQGLSFFNSDIGSSFFDSNSRLCTRGFSSFRLRLPTPTPGFKIIRLRLPIPTRLFQFFQLATPTLTEIPHPWLSH